MSMDGERRTESKVPSWIGQRAPLLLGLAVAAVLLTLFAEGRRYIADTSPYVQHIDERTLMRGARRVLQDDGLNPRIYNYPSLPFYLTAAPLSAAWRARKTRLGLQPSAAHEGSRV